MRGHRPRQPQGRRHQDDLHGQPRGDARGGRRPAQLQLDRRAVYEQPETGSADERKTSSPNPPTRSSAITLVATLALPTPMRSWGAHGQYGSCPSLATPGAPWRRVLSSCTLEDHSCSTTLPPARRNRRFVPGACHGPPPRDSAPFNSGARYRSALPRRPSTNADGPAVHGVAPCPRGLTRRQPVSWA